MSTVSRTELGGLREEIAKTTIEIIRAVGKRNGIAKQVGQIKNESALPRQDEAVEDALVRAVIEECDRAGVSRGAGLKILNVLIAESKRAQGINPVGVSESPMASFAKAVEMQKSGREVIRLDVGEPDFAPPRAVLQACSDALFSGKTHYTVSRGIPELIAGLKSYLKEKWNFDAGEEQLVVTTSGRFAVYASMASVVGEGESAIVVDPSWPAYKQALLQIGAKPIIVSTTLGDGWGLSAEAVKQAVRPNCKAIVLSYPNNPSGKILDGKTFEEVVGVANDCGLTVISDEAYSGYAFRDCPSILNSGADSFILASTFSKTWSMTGFRVGYAVSSKKTIDKILGMESLMLTSVAEFIQYGAIKALESEQEAKENRTTMMERVDSACEALDGVESLEYHRPDGAMYVFPRAKKSDFHAKRFADLLLEGKGVSVTPGTAFGAYPDSFRISLGQPKEAVAEGIRRIGEMLD